MPVFETKSKVSFTFSLFNVVLLTVSLAGPLLSSSASGLQNESMRLCVKLSLHGKFTFVYICVSTYRQVWLEGSEGKRWPRTSRQGRCPWTRHPRCTLTEASAHLEMGRQRKESRGEGTVTHIQTAVFFLYPIFTLGHSRSPWHLILTARTHSHTNECTFQSEPQQASSDLCDLSHTHLSRSVRVHCLQPHVLGKVSALPCLNAHTRGEERGLILHSEQGSNLR